jgi:hypothetical protein
MITKVCKVCQFDLKADTEFYKNDSTCKFCRKAKVRKNRADKIEYYKEYDKSRANNEHRVAARKSYAKTSEGLEAGNKAKHKWSEKNTKKVWVTRAVNNSIRDGKLSKSSHCQNCDKSDCRIEGHHDDYDRPLDVSWFCSACHRGWHKLNGEGANAH